MPRRKNSIVGWGAKLPNLFRSRPKNTDLSAELKRGRSYVRKQRQAQKKQKAEGRVVSARFEEASVALSSPKFLVVGIFDR